MESHTQGLRMCVKIDKMLIITVERCDGYQRFIIPFTLLVYMFENIHTRGLQELLKKKKKSVTMYLCVVCIPCCCGCGTSSETSECVNADV